MRGSNPLLLPGLCASIHASITLVPFDLYTFNKNAYMSSTLMVAGRHDSLHTPEHSCAGLVDALYGARTARLLLTVIALWILLLTSRAMGL